MPTPFMQLQLAYRKLLCSLLGIERWHAGGEERHPYRQEILRRLHARAPMSMLEIGCGLGDILCRVPAGRRLGGDVSARVLWAARLSHPLQWLVLGARFATLRLGEPVQGRFEAVVCVNFIHSIPPADLQAALRALVRDNLAPGGVLVLDVVRNPQYRYNHDPAFLLKDLGLDAEVVGGFEFGRSLVFAHKAAGA
jgi:SAM-dependent methyltransferase